MRAFRDLAFFGSDTDKSALPMQNWLLFKHQLQEILKNQATSGSVMLQVHTSSWDSFIKSWGTQRPKHQKDLIHCSCIRASCFMLVLQSWKAAITSKRHDPSFFFQEFMFQTCIAVIKKCWTTVVKTTKKIWYIILFFGNSCFKQVLR